MIWSPPMNLEGVYLVAWMAAALLVYETASTAYIIPHGALGMELTPHYHGGFGHFYAYAPTQMKLSIDRYTIQRRRLRRGLTP